MSQTLNAAIAVVGIDIGKNSFHIVGHDGRGAIVASEVVAWPGRIWPEQQDGWTYVWNEGCWWVADPDKERKTSSIWAIH